MIHTNDDTLYNVFHFNIPINNANIYDCIFRIETPRYNSRIPCLLYICKQSIVFL